MQPIKYLLIILSHQTYALDASQLEMQQKKIDTIFKALRSDGAEEKDFIKALHTVCDNHNVVACYNLSPMYLHKSFTKVIKQDGQKAIILISKACNFGYNYACRDVSQLHAAGDFGIPQNVVKALDANEIMCTRNITNSCKYLANVYMDGEFIKQDKEKAERYYAKACALGDVTSCFETQG